MPPLPQRRSVRLAGYDYGSHGAYFITICSANRSPLFGTIEGHNVQLSPLGQVVLDEWRKTGPLRSVQAEVFVVMPNHFHAIVEIGPRSGARTGKPFPPASPLPGGGQRRTPPVLGSLVAGFKAAVTSRARRELGVPGQVWQRGYHEHVIRDEADLSRIGEYIASNPSRWADDRYHVGQP